MTTNTNLCKQCANRFRRIYVPFRPENYINENGEELSDTDIIIMISCLVSGIDIENEFTIECSHFKAIEGNTETEENCFLRSIKK